MPEAIDKARTDNPLGSYLKDRRAKLDPAEFGIEATRRRTPGLRREEVAQRANVSATWYMWLEQGRGGSPSSDVLDRLARALALTSALASIFSCWRSIDRRKFVISRSSRYPRNCSGFSMR